MTGVTRPSERSLPRRRAARPGWSIRFDDDSRVWGGPIRMAPSLAGLAGGGCASDEKAWNACAVKSGRATIVAAVSIEGDRAAWPASAAGSSQSPPRRCWRRPSSRGWPSARSSRRWAAWRRGPPPSCTARARWPRPPQEMMKEMDQLSTAFDALVPASGRRAGARARGERSHRARAAHGVDGDARRARLGARRRRADDHADRRSRSHGARHRGRPPPSPATPSRRRRW